MKLIIVLAVVLVYSALMLTNAAPQQTGQPGCTCPCACPTPTTTPAQQTPPAQPSPAVMTTATPPLSPTATAMPTASPTATSTPVPGPTDDPYANATKDCAGKVQASGIPLCSTKQPTTSTLSKDSILDRLYELAAPGKRIGPVLFTHEAHTKPAYSIDGVKPVGCVECHHTDQPKSALTGRLKTSQRADVLTADLFTKTPAASPVLSCRACHAQKGKLPAVGQMIPLVTYPAADPDDPDSKPETVTLTNFEAYHRNCTACHEKAIDARKPPNAAKFIKGPPPKQTSCGACHNPITQT
ncbi:MAG: hypothetical protein DMF64_04500 [Acidobacteria bacterium]|nr:MAG: hypothetical protein DMF64_04500 [Acidobacteriota bacterium]